MMGERQVDQAALFYEFSLEDHIPSDHLVRGIDRFLDLSNIRTELAPFYSATGRPSVDPELMIRMLVIGYCCGIRSERRLCEEVHLNLASQRTVMAGSVTATCCGLCSRPYCNVASMKALLAVRTSRLMAV